MDEAGKSWGDDHQTVLLSLCLNVISLAYGKECSCIVKILIDNPNLPKGFNLSSLEESSKLPHSDFEKAISALVARNFILVDPISLNVLKILQTIFYPHLVKFAQKFSIIPQDNPLIELIISKIIQQSGLSPQIISDTIATKNPEFDRDRLFEIVNNLICQHVLDENESHEVSFNYSYFIIKKRLEALCELLEYSDSRAIEVLKIIYGPDNLEQSLINCQDMDIDIEALIPNIADQTELDPREVAGVIDLFRSPEFSIISQESNTLTPSHALTCFKMKKIARLLGEIGYPFARRVVNQLLKRGQTEENYLSELLLMTPEECKELLEKLKQLGILKCEPLQDAPHTTLKRKYTMWSLSPNTAVNNCSSYLLAIISSMYQELIKQQEILDKSVGNQNLQKKTEKKINIINNTINSASEKYIEIQHL